MKVSEFLSQLEDRRPDAPILVSEIGALDSMLLVESIVGNKDEAVLLMARPIPTMLNRDGTPATRASRVLSEAMAQGVTKRFNVKIIPATQNPGKFQVEIDGLRWPQEFDTQNEAMTFMGGFTWGFSVGGGIKNMADGLPSRLT